MSAMDGQKIQPCMISSDSINASAKQQLMALKCNFLLMFFSRKPFFLGSRYYFVVLYQRRA